jgi:hypothetical protein
MLARPTAALLAALLLSACMGGPAPAGPATPEPLPTPLAVPNAAIEAARATVASHLAAAGYGLEQTTRRYRPSEPSVLHRARHSVFRVSGIDRNQGWVVIYDLGTPEAAAAAALEFARYLQTFGRPNFAGDAQFTINQVGPALVFHWWSPSRTTDAEALRQAFEAITGVGQRYEVVG